MLSIMAQMAAVIACGIVWRFWQPNGLDTEVTRRVLTTVVYYFLLPALVLKVLWVAPLGWVSAQIALVSGLTVLGSLLLAGLICRLCRMDRASSGALLLVAGWPNAVYLGLPVLERLFGAEGRAIAIQYDLFGALPLLFTVGVLIASHYGTQHSGQWGVVKGLFRVPSLWAALVGMSLNATGVPLPVSLDELLGLLGYAVTPLMLFSLGLALQFQHLREQSWQPLLTVAGIQLVLAPLMALAWVAMFGLTGIPAQATVLEAAMPAMVLGLVLCDRFGLNTALYATAVTFTTLLSLLSLPVWFYILG